MKTTKIKTNKPLPFLFTGNRDEISNVPLSAVAGKIPEDLHGYILLMTQCGTVNSGGYPYPEKIDKKPNPEFGSPVLNGNGMIFAFDLSNSGQVNVSSKLVKPPSYYADEATRIGGPAREEKEFKGFHFSNSGICRMSFLLGTVNYGNTAIIPVNFNSDSGVSILATYDTGRPMKIDPETLEFITPIGYNKEWRPGMPPFLQAPFPMFETTAHPSWDPLEKVLYGVNFTKSEETELSRTILYELLRRDKGSITKELINIANGFDEEQEAAKSIDEEQEAVKKARGKIDALLNKRITDEKAKRSSKKKKGFLKKIFSPVLKWFEKLLENFVKEETTTKDSVYLIKFDGSGELQSWRLVDEKGKDLKIYQCMHQTSVTQDYIVLMDSSFKFAMDLLFTNPFPHLKNVDKLLRFLLSKTILPSTKVWIINKNQLKNKKTVIARAVKGQPIPGLSNEPHGGVPMECVHFSSDYANPNNEITIYTAHNNDTCLAEWIRTYDVNHFTKEAYNETNISNYAAGQLALSSVGKYVIDGSTAFFKPGANKIIREKGNLPPVNELEGKPLSKVGPNTWGIGLYAYRDMISPTVAGMQIKQLFFVSFGTQPELLSEFIYNLYKRQNPNRSMNLKELLAYTECGIPQSIISIATESMKIEEHFEFEWGTFPMSIQFIPLNSNNSVPSEKDGYIWLTAKTLIEKDDTVEYQSRIYIFKAWNISEGPICILAGEGFNFCTSLHIAWLENKQQVHSEYIVNIEDDFNWSIENSFLKPFERTKYQDFFNKYVYPNFPKN